MAKRGNPILVSTVTTSPPMTDLPSLIRMVRGEPLEVRTALELTKTLELDGIEIMERRGVKPDGFSDKERGLIKGVHLNPYLSWTQVIWETLEDESVFNKLMIPALRLFLGSFQRDTNKIKRLTGFFEAPGEAYAVLHPDTLNWLVKLNLLLPLLGTGLRLGVEPDWRRRGRKENPRWANSFADAFYHDPRAVIAQVRYYNECFGGNIGVVFDLSHTLLNGDNLLLTWELIHHHNLEVVAIHFSLADPKAHRGSLPPSQKFIPQPIIDQVRYFLTKRIEDWRGPIVLEFAPLQMERATIEAAEISVEFLRRCGF